MDAPFEIAGGSVLGSAHALAGRSNQDAFCWSTNGAALVAVVCDGCSGASHSDVGAKIASRLLVRSVAARLGTGLAAEALLEAARGEVAEHLRSLAVAMSVEARDEGDEENERAPGAVARYRRTVAEHFLFTVVGLLVDRDAATTFSLGDGIVVVNGERGRLGPFANNAPPYLGYALLQDETARSGFALGPTLPAGELETALLGTDGVVDLEGLADRSLPGEGARVGPLRQFWEGDTFFRNPDMVRRRLTVINRGVDRGARAGWLPDDTTLITVRRVRARARAVAPPQEAAS